MNDLRYFISTNFKGCAATNKREIPHEQCVTILNKNGVLIEFYEKDNLLQIFGLTDKDFKSLVDCEGRIINFD